MAMICSAILFLPDHWFALLWGLAIAVCAWEWADIAGLTTFPTRGGFVLACVGVMTSYQQWAGDMEEWLAWPVVAWWFLFSIILRKYPGKLLEINYPTAVKVPASLAYKTPATANANKTTEIKAP